MLKPKHLWLLIFVFIFLILNLTDERPLQFYSTYCAMLSNACKIIYRCVIKTKVKAIWNPPF